MPFGSILYETLGLDGSVSGDCPNKPPRSCLRNAIAAIAGEIQRDAAGRTPKGASNLSHCDVLKMQAGQCHSLFELGLFVALELGCICGP